jgi:hypothetical protein
VLWAFRLEMAAGLLWWWNPLYWLTRRRLDVEAELACDEWAVRTFPEGRLDYAEALLEVSRSLSKAERPVTVLGVAGAGHILERRVNMILREQNPSGASTWVLIVAGILTLLALPCWSATGSSPRQPAQPASLISGQDAGKKDALHPKSDDIVSPTVAKQQARRLLQEARRGIIQGDYAEAEKNLTGAQALDVKWGLFDDNPNKVRLELNKARHVQSLNPAPRLGKSMAGLDGRVKGVTVGLDEVHLARSRRIKAMRELIDQLNKELKELEYEDNVGTGR